MISVTRPNPPPRLASVRRKRLKRAADAVNAGGAPCADLEKVLKGGYQQYKDVLYLAQHKKCAWCERYRDLSSSEVEHYRPKDGAWRHLPGALMSSVDSGSYWWLTWTWENLLFTCARCNDRGHKANYFPVVAGTAAPSPGRPVVVTPAVPDPVVSVATERPLLLDPTDSVVNPMDHLWWEPQNPKDPPLLWRWLPRWHGQRGYVTQRILNLGELADEVGDHVRKDVLKRVQTVIEHARAGRLAEARRDWDDLIADKLTDVQQSFRGPTWVALMLLVPQRKRRKWHLTDPSRP